MPDSTRGEILAEIAAKRRADTRSWEQMFAAIDALEEASGSHEPFDIVETIREMREERDREIGAAIGWADDEEHGGEVMRTITVEQAREPLSESESEYLLHTLAELRAFRDRVAHESGVEFFPDSTPLVRAMRDGTDDVAAVSLAPTERTGD